MNWFTKLTGFQEINPDQVRQNLKLENQILISLVNGYQYDVGRLEIPTLGELRQEIQDVKLPEAKLSITELVADVSDLHKDPVNQGAFFQAASQFNLLEMINPQVKPEHGIGIYENDFTQGPACAIACGAGTIYRNYFVELEGQIGQTASNQVDCLSELGKAFNNEELLLWQMTNGYALANPEGLKHISGILTQKTPEEYDQLKAKLKIGIQWDTEVTISQHKHQVTQAYCAALPVAYSYVDADEWEDFARLILEATYEATFCAAIKNYQSTGNQHVFLTLVGGGAFGNEYLWIFDAIQQSLNKFKHFPLDIKIVSYGSSKPEVSRFMENWEK